MKTKITRIALTEYLKKNINNISESSNYNYKKLTFAGIDGGSKMIDSIKNVCQTHVPNVYYMSGDNSDINIDVNKDNLKTVQEIIDLVRNFIADIPNDEHDNIASQLNKLTEQVDNIQVEVNTLSEDDKATQDDDKDDEDNKKSDDKKDSTDKDE